MIASRLSARTYARFCASLQPAATITGISAMPSCRAASTLAWPAIRPPCLAHQRRARPAPLLDARGYRGDLGIRVGPCIFGIWDQPLDRPPLDPIGRPRSLISGDLSRAGARVEGGEVSALLRAGRVATILGYPTDKLSQIG